MAKWREEERVLDVNAAMQGSLIFSDPVNLRINGRFEGNLKTKGVLTIGENAKVFADIEGEKIVIAGYVKGKIKALQGVSLTSTAEVNADIDTPILSIQEGANFNGKCKMRGEKIELKELAEYLSVEEAKIVEWVNSGKLSATKENDKLIFDRKEVEAWIEQNR
ncbi:MAG: polymer-forming cytoskeletal protein [Candidatus Omnitrophica bacterium]|nr:polymer-forming cytoskeletal protein [Candidatus Omnitrophota bacterium]MCM8826936.1 polymer-forming cytoskeletal protein [Candidatus Omnitrophota bacterium]